MFNGMYRYEYEIVQKLFRDIFVISLIIGFVSGLWVGDV